MSISVTLRQGSRKALARGMSGIGAGWLWPGMLMGLAVAALALIWFPVLRFGAVASINYNEGWNAYRDQMAAQSRPLYGAPPGLWVTNYPFLSFHLIGLLGKISGSVTLAGRIVALTSLIMASLLITAIIRVIVGSWRGGLYGGLCFFLWIAIFTPDRVGMNDPEMLALAIMLCGVFAYVRAPSSLPWLTISAVAFALGMFTKHDLFALPVGIGLHLLGTRNWRGLAVWTSAGLIVAGLLLFATFRLDGPYFFANLLVPRAYLPRHMLSMTMDYLQLFYAPLALGVALLITPWDMPRRGLLLLLLVACQVVSLLFTVGDGVAQNVFFAPLAIAAIACAVAICSIEPVLRPMPWGQGLLMAALSLPALPALTHLPTQLYADIGAWKSLPDDNAHARKIIAALDQTKGPALCEDILLCFRAGKPLDFDPYFVKDQIMAGRMKEAPILSALRSHDYSVIEIGDGDSGIRLAPGERMRFTSAFMRTLFADYRPVLVDRPFAVFLPRRSAK